MVLPAYFGSGWVRWADGLALSLARYSESESYLNVPRWHRRTGVLTRRGNFDLTYSLEWHAENLFRVRRLLLPSAHHFAIVIGDLAINVQLE